ncbi:lytic transglycosylase domain-containing protein [Pectinatus sottacetonis]|uniref:lytic transglycosylase domain-containing protein n=1 Tax=Pectinatus sottacetonis TaxID=1002795 RepID=UPI001E41F026|nr:lytic transglycosylase domain-containing protein [Pectinatus sottacetonis]
MACPCEQAGYMMSNTKDESTSYVMRIIQGFMIMLLFLTVTFAGIYEGLQTHVIEKVEKKYFYPYPYEQVINKYAQKYNMDSTLVAGIILAESKFVPNAKSHRGAIGLMQIMPETGQWIAKNISDNNYTDDKLYDPETNIRYGVWYLAFLMREFRHNEILAVAAYNAGHGQIEQWQQIYHWGRNFADYKKIPYKETRDYVKRVLDNRKSYKKLYSPN